MHDAIKRGYYEIRLRNGKRGVNLVSDALPFRQRPSKKISGSQPQFWPQ
jgi:hypothetical protein